MFLFFLLKGVIFSPVAIRYEIEILLLRIPFRLPYSMVVYFSQKTERNSTPFYKWRLQVDVDAQAYMKSYFFFLILYIYRVGLQQQLLFEIRLMLFKCHHPFIVLSLSLIYNNTYLYMGIREICASFK